MTSMQFVTTSRFLEEIFLCDSVICQLLIIIFKVKYNRNFSWIINVNMFWKISAGITAAGYLEITYLHGERDFVPPIWLLRSHFQLPQIMLRPISFPCFTNSRITKEGSWSEITVGRITSINSVFYLRILFISFIHN